MDGQANGKSETANALPLAARSARLGLGQAPRMEFREEFYEMNSTDTPPANSTSEAHRATASPLMPSREAPVLQ